MASYNDEEIASMRNDAIRRVQEMQKRSQNIVSNNQGTQRNIPQERSQMPENSRDHQNNQNISQSNNQNNLHSNNSHSSAPPPPINNSFNNMNMGNTNPLNSLFSGLMGGGGNQKKPQPLLQSLLPSLGGHGGENGEKSSGFLGGLLDGILGEGKIDSEKIILIGLIILLAREGCDLKLLIAIGYLLM